MPAARRKRGNRSVRQQLGYLKRNLGVIDQMLSKGKVLSRKQQKRLEIVRTLYEQQKAMYDNKVHSVKDRIVSLSQPYLRSRGSGTEIQFGKTEMWPWADYDKTPSYNGACGCHVHSAVEPEEGSTCPSAISI